MYQKGGAVVKALPHWDVKPKNKQATMHSPNGMQLAK